jgi:adenosylcobinamide-GDP ribazoletransferase
MLRQELLRFFAALRFFTRLPVPAWVGHSQDQLDHATRYFPLIGVLVGAITALVTAAAASVLPISLAIVLGMTASVLLTGAFHEDGFADVCDGFGGGGDKAQVLTIMKDSRVGSYTVVGVGLLLLAKWNALNEIDAAFDWPALPLALVAAHAASRLASVSLIFALDYVREDATTKAKPLATRMARHELAIAAVCGLSPCLLLPLAEALTALAAMGITTWLLARYFVRRIGGYTGDCLGATQQLAELAFYLGLLCSFT